MFFLNFLTCRLRHHPLTKPRYAGVAQLVEHHLAKVDVEGSNPFARSNFRVNS